MQLANNKQAFLIFLRTAKKAPPQVSIAKKISYFYNLMQGNQ